MVIKKMSELAKNGSFNFDHQVFSTDVALKINDIRRGVNVLRNQRAYEIKVLGVADINHPTGFISKSAHFGKLSGFKKRREILDRHLCLERGVGRCNGFMANNAGRPRQEELMPLLSFMDNGS